MRPRFRFFYALAAAVVTYGMLAAFSTPRPFGEPGWHHGRHGWDQHTRHAGGCGGTCAPAHENTPANPAE